MMKSIFLAPTLLVVAAGSLVAQQPAPPAAASKIPVRLDAIVAVVGDQAITRYDLSEAVLTRIQRREVEEPKDSAAAMALDSLVLDDMIQDELIVQKAKDLKITIPDADITPQVDRQVKDVRGNFENDAQFRAELQKAGLGTPDEYRKYLMEQFRRQLIRDRVIRKLTQDGKIIPINVTDAEISAEFERAKTYLPKKPATVTFKQIVIAPQPTAAAKEVARVRAESVLATLKSGADFEKLAKRESMDLQSKENGGDLGWARRGTQVPEFERWLFGSPFAAATQPGQLTPVFETSYGFHIVRVDRVNGAEVKARQILIAPKIDSADVERTHQVADSVAKAWKAGAPFDSLAKKYHDYRGSEETSILTPFWRDSLPVTYQKGFLLHKAGDIVVFQIAGSAKRPDVPKWVVAQLLSSDEGGERTLPEMREAVRSELAQRGAVRRYIDGLKKQTFVVVKLKDVTVAEAPKPDKP
jgi:peptidyl-prolyl cis-trans isomerase SurA